MTKTLLRLGGFLPNKVKLYTPLFTNSQKSFPVSLSITAMDDHVKNVLITLVYWDNGQKKYIKDYLAGGATTQIDFVINNPTSIPPFILYMEVGGLPGTIDIEVDYSMSLFVSSLDENDSKIITGNEEVLPTISSLDMFCQKSILDKIIGEIKDLFETAEETRSPLVLDLDGDGIETITADSGVYFDHDGNLFQEKTAWVAKDDALLVKDIRLAA